MPMLKCQACGATWFRTSEAAPTDRGILHCGRCGVPVCPLCPPGAPPFRYEPAAGVALSPGQEGPPTSWEWLGLVRHDDGSWRPVALAETLERCWDALLHYPGRL